MYQYVCLLSRAGHVWLFKNPWITVCQAPVAVGFARQEYGSGLSFPPTGDLPNPGIELASPGSPPVAGGFPTTASPGKSQSTTNSSQVIMWTGCGVSTSYNSPTLFPPSHMVSLSLYTCGHSLPSAYELVPPPDICMACSLTSFKYLLKCHFLSEARCYHLI